mgnify:CR=1 FL=1|tara:strand:- start:2557 stop:2913 length:357 start_codon:yes stop_codon:yes gene_type:complete
MSKELISKAKSHFAGIMSGEMKSFFIEEWDHTFFYKAGTNFKNESKILELQNAGKTGDALVQMIINRCLDKDGKRMFNEHQKAELMNSVDPNVIVKIVNALNQDEDDDTIGVEEAAKN